MNYIYILSFVVIVSLAFGRLSKNYSSSDDSFSVGARQFSVESSDASSDDSAKWKRRHKKRKKSRRPQRGR